MRGNAPLRFARRMRAILRHLFAWLPILGKVAIEAMIAYQARRSSKMSALDWSSETWWTYSDVVSRLA